MRRPTLQIYLQKGPLLGLNKSKSSKYELDFNKLIYNYTELKI